MVEKSVYVPTDEEKSLASWVHNKFLQSKAGLTTLHTNWKKYMDAYSGEYFKNESLPEYKSDEVSNFVFATIETIRPIMVDNNPRFQVKSRTPEGLDKAEMLQIAMDYEWDRERMDVKLPQALMNSLIIGTSVVFVPWDAREQNVRCIIVNPFNIYPDPIATTVDDSEYIIYATYKNSEQVKQAFPDKANLLDGGDIKHEELVAYRQSDQPVRNQILILECWCRDYTFTEEENGKQVRKFPRGRVITVAPEHGIVFSDKQNPYQDGRFPFRLIKNYDLPNQFWGEGEVKQLLSPQTYINELNNQIIDNAKNTANMQWIVDKNAGIGYGKLTNRPGLVIRKNPGSDVRRDPPPPMPAYVNDKILELKDDIETISGIHDATQGQRPTGIQAGNAIMALQEAGQSRIRLKVKIMESCLNEIGTMWYSRMRQFWKQERYVSTVREDGTQDFKQISSSDMLEDFDIRVLAGSSMPLNKNAMLDLMIRLGQTQAEDGLPVIDRETLLEYVPFANKKRILQKFAQREEENKQAMMNEQQVEQFGQMIQQLNQAVQQLNKEVDDIQGNMQDEEIRKQDEETQKQHYERGLQEGKNMQQQATQMKGADTPPDEMAGMLPDASMNSDEIVAQLSQMSEDELITYLQQNPELEGIIANQYGA